MTGTISLFDLLTDRGLNSLAAFMRRRAVRKNRFSGIAVPIDDLIGIRLFSTGSFEQTQLDGVISFVETIENHKDKVFLDVGANIGVFSLLLNGCFNRSLAFEPNPITYGYLTSNLAMGGAENVEPVNLALSETAGEMDIYLPLNGNLGWATLNADHHTVPVRKLAIKSETLDSFVAKNDIQPDEIGLIKIDVEGHELQVLRGATNTLRAYQPPILCEVLSSDYGNALLEHLRDVGYSKFSVFKRDFSNILATRVVQRAMDPDNLQADALVLVQA